jgi:acetyl esterase/lipase
VAHVHRTVGAHGGDPAALFLMGHSAGAHLAAHVALDTAVLAREGVPAAAVCGVIPVSGAALDLTDRPSVRGDYDYYGARFAPPGVVVPEAMPDVPMPWQRDASVVPLVRPGAPPFLVLYAGGETRALQRQAELLVAALRKAAVPVTVAVVPGQSHERIVLTLSRNDRTAGPALLRFVRETRCR